MVNFCCFSPYFVPTSHSSKPRNRLMSPQKAKQMPRMTKNSPAIRLLRHKFERGDITGTKPPKQVWLSEKVFQKHKLNAFRAQYYLMRKHYENLNHRSCSENTADILERRKPNTSNSCEASVEDDDISEEKPLLRPREGVEILLAPNEFKPLYLLSVWTDPKTTQQKISCAIILPSGVGKGEFGLHVVNGGDILEVRVCWPRPLVDIDFLYKTWLDTNVMDTSHPRFGGFHNSLKRFRERRSDKTDLGWIGHPSKAIYIDMEQAGIEEYFKINEDDEFVVA
ncbi:hypothetical protein FGB62_176g05 [Gracilaria domingensis]|nr:hypothetical protein FGB62_351g03 [Gracilaria domingensis]KAI0558959.1 hypothetical protein FGB62_176g05 [Gracilaria domingensis]